MATSVAKSGMFTGVRTAEQAIALMLLCQAEGMHPAIALRDYHVIQGRPTLKADAMLSRFIQSGGKVKWTCFTDEKVSAIFSHPSTGELEIDWTFERAQKAGLTGKDVWRQYPRNMLKARVISDGIRMMNPSVNSGMYTPEEVMDFDTKPQSSTEKIVEGEVIIDRSKEIIDAIAAKGKEEAKVLAFIKKKYSVSSFSELGNEAVDSLLSLINKD